MQRLTRTGIRQLRFNSSLTPVVAGGTEAEGLDANHDRVAVNGRGGLLSDYINYFRLLYRVQSSPVSEDVIELEVALRRQGAKATALARRARLAVDFT